MKLSRWQPWKYTRGGRAYMTIRGDRYYADDIAAVRKMHQGVQFHGVSWCGFYLVQFDRHGEEVRWTYVE